MSHICVFGPCRLAWQVGWLLAGAAGLRWAVARMFELDRFTPTFTRNSMPPPPPDQRAALAGDQGHHMGG